MKPKLSTSKIVKELAKEYGFEDERKLKARLEGAHAQEKIHEQLNPDIKKQRKAIHSLHIKIDALQLALKNLEQADYNKLSKLVDVNLYELRDRIELDLEELKCGCEIALLRMNSSNKKRPLSNAWPIVEYLADFWYEEKRVYPTCGADREYNGVYIGEFYKFTIDFFRLFEIEKPPSGRTVSEILRNWRTCRTK
jgi:hypothetical protein